MNIGRATTTGNCAQIYFGYDSNNSVNNSTNFAVAGKAPVLTLYNDSRINFNGNITVTTPSVDPLTLINTTTANTVMNIGRATTTGNCAQIYFGYVSNNSVNNSTNFAVAGKAPVLTLYNDSRIDLNGKTTVTTSSGDPLTLINTTDEYTVMNLGRSLSPGNVAQIAFRYVASDSANNAMNFGYYGKATNLSLFNDLSSTFFGKVVCPNIEIGTLTRLSNRSITSNPNFTLIYCANRADSASHLFCSADGSIGYVKINTAAYTLEVDGSISSTSLNTGAIICVGLTTGALICSSLTVPTLISGGTVGWGNDRPSRPAPGTAGGYAGWNQTGGHGEVDFYNNYGTAGLSQFQFWKNNGTAWESIVTIGHSGEITCGGITASNRITTTQTIGWGQANAPRPDAGVAGGAVGWNQSGGNGEVSFYNNLVSAGALYTFYKNNGTAWQAMVTIGNSGEISCGFIGCAGITSTVSSGDPLTLINTTASNTAMNIGRATTTGNCAQIYFGYDSNDSVNNSTNFAFAGKAPVLTVYNDSRINFNGKTTITTASGDPITLINTTDEYTVMNLGRSLSPGNIAQIAFRYVANDSASNAMNFGYYGKDTNLSLFNDLSSTFFGKVVCPNIEIGTLTRLANRSITSNVNFTLIYCANMGNNSSHLFCSADGGQGYVKINTNEGYFLEVLGWTKCETIISSGYIRWGQATPARPGTSTAGGAIGWNQTGGEAEVDFFNNFGTGGANQFRFWKNNGSNWESIVTIGHSGQIQCGNITVTTSSGDPLTLINTTNNAVMNLGRSLSPGNVSQIFFNYVGDNSTANSTNFGFYGKDTNLALYNDRSSVFFGNVLVATINSGAFTVLNQNNSILETDVTFGRENSTGNSGLLRYTQFGPDASNNVISLGFKGKLANLALTNDSNSSFRGNVTVTTSSGDPLTLINNTNANTVINFGRALSNGNCAQIYYSYSGNNSDNNEIRLGPYGKDSAITIRNNSAYSYSAIYLNGPLNIFWPTNSTCVAFANHMVFNVAGGAQGVGSISNNGANISYNTSSDYRLKEDVQPLSGSILFKLRPVSYKWKLNQSNGFGFLAHELQQHIPSMVVGSKDEVDDEGKPKHQAVDYSKLTPFLTAAIQEQQAVIEQQKNQIVDLQEKYQALLIRLELLEAGR